MNPFEGDREKFDDLKNFGLGAVDPDRLIGSVVDPIRNFINKGDAEPTDFSKSDKKYGDIVDHRSAQRIADKKAQQELDDKYSQLVDYYRHDDGTPYSSFEDDAKRDGLPKWMQQKALYSVQQEYADSQELAGGPVNGRSKQVLDRHLLDAGDSAFEDYENHLNRQAHVESSERKLNVLLPVFQNGVEGLSEDESKIYSVVSFMAEQEDVPVDHVYDNLGAFVKQYSSMMGVKATTAMDLHAPMKQGLELQRKGVDSDVENYKAGRLAAIKGQALRAGINGITSDDKQRAGDLFTTGHASIADEYGEHLKLGGKLYQLYSNKKTKVSQSYENAGVDGSFSGYAKFMANPIMGTMKLGVGFNQERDAEQYAMAETLASLPRAEAKKVMEVAMLMAEAEAGTMDDDFFTKFTESMYRGGTKYLNGIQDTIGRAADVGYSDEEATKRQRVRETLQDLGDIKDIHSEITSESKVIAGAYDMAASLPYMAAYATGVGGGLNALTMMTDADKELRKKYPDMSPTARWKVAVPTGLVNSGIETLQFKSWTRGFTSFSKSVGSNGIAGIAGLGLTRGVAQLATENLEESAQSIARPAIQWVWSKLGDDVSDVTREDWDESFFIYDERTFFATLPLAVLGAGGRTTYDVMGAKQNEVFLSDVDRMRLYGISEDKAQAIAAQPDAMKKWLMFKDNKATISNQERETTIKEAISEGVLERVAKADDEASFKEYEQKILESGTANQKATLEVEKTEREYREKFDAKVSEEGDQFKITYPQTTGKPSEIFSTVEEAQTALHTHQVEVNEQFLEEIGTAAKNLEAMDLHKADLESLHKGAEVKLGEDSITMEDFAAQGEEQMKQALERIEHELLRMGTPREATVADLKNWKADGQVTLKREARGYVAKLSKGANIADLVEEGSEGFVRDLVQGGIVSSKWLKEQIFQYQLDTGNKMTKAKSADEMSDQQMVEAFSDLAVANFWNAHSNDKLGAMGGIVNALRIFFNKVMQIADDLAKLGKEGKIDADFQTLLDNSVGLNMDQQIEDNVPKYQQEIIDENDTFSLQQVNKTSANDMADALGVARTIPAEYIGKKILPIMADHLGVGDADGVPMQGGAGHPLQNFGTGVGWRSKRGAIAGIYGYLKKRGGIWKDEDGHEWALVTPFGMTQESHKSNKSTFFAYIKALENVNMSKAQKKALGEYIRLRADKEINSVKKKKLNVSRMQQFPLDWTKTQLDALTHDFSHDERAYLMDGLKLAGAKHLGVPDVQTVINQLRDDSYDKVNAGSMLSLLKVDVTRLKEGLKKDTENGLDASDFGVDEHLSYDTVLPAEIVTHLRQPIDMNVAFPDMIAKMKEVSPKSQPAYLLQAKLPAAVELQTLTPELVETINAEQGTEVTSIAKAKSYINALGDKWNVLEKGKMKGAANFIAAMERNEYRETLTPIDMDTLKADVKSGELKVYGLDGFDVWFGIRNRTDGGKELVNVISNELSTGGMIDLVMMKAISEGVTHLDAYSVKSEKFPNGLLPTLYGRYGFKATSEDAYDKNYLGSTAKARNTKEKALKELWAKQGWDSSGQEMPSLVYMRYEQTAIQSQSDSSLSVVAGPLVKAGTTATESTSGDGGVSESRTDGDQSSGDAGGDRGTLPRRVDSFIDQLRSASPARLKAWQLDESERDQLVATHSTTFSITPTQDGVLQLKNGVTLEKQEARFDDRDTWLFKKEESTVGYLSVGTEFAEDRQTPRIIDIKIKDEARGQGLAREALPKLVKEYGVLSSDNTGKTSDDAKKMWESVGGREPNKNDTPSGDALFILKSDEITMSLTSSEDSLIDKLNAMMRDQDTRIEIYRNMTTRLNDVRQRIHTNKHSSDFITQNMAEMEAVVSVLPAELRHRAFSAKTLASKKTGASASRYMVERLEYIDKILERFLKGELTEQVVKVINQSQPLAKSGGNQGPSKIGALGHEVAKAAKAAIFMSPMEAEKASALELSKLEKFGEPTAVQTQEHGDVAYAYEVFADIKNADSTRLTVMLELLQTNWEQGRKQWLTELKDRKDWKEGKVDAILRGLDKIEKNDAETNEAQNKGQSWWANKARSLLSFYQVTDMLREGMGKDGSVIKEMADDLRRANGDFEMEQLLHKEKMRNAFAKIFGIGKTNRTARIQGRLNTIAKGVDRGDKLTTSRMYDFTVKSWGADIEKAKDMLRANPDRTDILLGKTPLTRDEFDEVYESYTLDVDAGFFDPTKKNKKYSIVLQRNSGERWNVGEKSQLDLANDWLAMQQTDLKSKYKKTGHDEQYERELSEALDDDVKELAMWMQNELRKSTPRTEALHRQEYGLLMATVQNYFPASFEHAQKGGDTVLAMDGIDVAGVGTKPSAHKMRINHASRPVRTNAVNAFNHHVMQNAYWNTHAEVLRKWGGVIRNKDVQDAILRSHGKGFLSQLLTQFEDYETQGAKVAAAQIASDRMWRGLTKGVSLGVLGGRMTTIAKNMAAMMNVALGEDIGTLAKGLHPSEWKQDGAELWNSDTMQRRLKIGANVATRYALQGSPSGHVVLATATNAAEASMQLINLADTGSNMMMTLAYTAKKRELRQTKQYTEAEIKAIALDHVDDLMERYAQPTNRLSKSLAENTRHPMAQILVMFQSESRKMMSINALAIRKILTGKGTQSKGMAAQQLVVQVVLMNGFIHAISAAYDAFVKGEGDGEDEGEKLMANLTDWKKLAATMAADSLSGVPILGEGWSMTWKSIFDQKVFVSSNNPAVKPILGIQAFIKGAEDMGESTASETADKWLRGTQALASVLPQTAILAQGSTLAKDALGFFNNTLSKGFTEADTHNIYRKRIKDVIRRTGKEFAEDIENAENMGVKRGLEMERKALILERAGEILFDIPEGKRKKFLMDQLQSDESGTIPKYIIRNYLTQ
jgi:hypothetical protein